MPENEMNLMLEGLLASIPQIRRRRGLFTEAYETTLRIIVDGKVRVVVHNGIVFPDSIGHHVKVFQEQQRLPGKLKKETKVYDKHLDRWYE